MTDKFQTTAKTTIKLILAVAILTLALGKPVNADLPIPGGQRITDQPAGGCSRSAIEIQWLRARVKELEDGK